MKDKLDWIEECFRVYNEDNWLTDMTFRKTAFTLGTHDHCYVDAKRITDNKAYLNFEECDMQGYYSKDGNIWLCKNCFDYIQKRHTMREEKNTIKDIESALTQLKTVVISLENEQYFLKNENGKIVVMHNGTIKMYDDILSMEREQFFYGKPLREIMDDIFISVE